MIRDKQARKDVAQIFNHLLRRQIGSRLPTVEYLSSKPDVVLSALKGYVRSCACTTSSLLPETTPRSAECKEADDRWNTYRYENAEVALNTGAILHEMLRHEALAKSLLYSPK